ncbi:hypothetical protein PoB_003140700 [Plakobranchus ocellatus]|uniref:Uncharacterized protein n=1 Tax=Plakobranchus ocellatus TaxID=259542 RepID=A0AAV4AD85_9GAST|nr:hypothetical protein PoB_003140700 [Plakobranchus ocellatus]
MRLSKITYPRRGCQRHSERYGVKEGVVRTSVDSGFSSIIHFLVWDCIVRHVSTSVAWKLCENAHVNAWQKISLRKYTEVYLQSSRIEDEFPLYLLLYRSQSFLSRLTRR